MSMSYLKLGRYSAEPGCREETMVYAANCIPITDDIYTYEIQDYNRFEVYEI